MDDMSEYYRQISEIQEAVREREMYRLELEKERLLKTQRREKRHEELRDKIKSLHKELVTEEFEAAQRVRKLLSQVEAVTREHQILEVQTEKLRNKKQQYEAQLEKAYPNLKSNSSNFYLDDLYQTGQRSYFIPPAASTGILPQGASMLGYFPRETNASGPILQRASTPIQAPAMSNLNPFSMAVPQASPIAPSLAPTSQWSVQQPGNTFMPGTMASQVNTTQVTVPHPLQHPGVPQPSLNLSQQEELAKRNSTLPNGGPASSAPTAAPSITSQIQYLYQEAASMPPASEQGFNPSFSNSSSFVTRNQSESDHLPPEPRQGQAVVSFEKSAHHDPVNQSFQTISSHPTTNGTQNPVYVSSDVPSFQAMQGESAVHFVPPGRTDITLSQIQNKESTSTAPHLQPISTNQNNQGISAPNLIENPERKLKVEEQQAHPVAPPHSAAPVSSNDSRLTSQRSEEASTSTGLPTRPTITGLSEAHSIDSVQANNEMMDESLPLSPQEHSQDQSQERNRSNELPPSSASTSSKSASCDLSSNGKTADSNSACNVPDTKQLERKQENAEKQPESKRDLGSEDKDKQSENKTKLESGSTVKDTTKTTDNSKITTTKEKTPDPHEQRVSQSDSNTPPSATGNNNQKSSISNASTKSIVERDTSNSKSSSVQSKGDSTTPSPSDHKAKDEIQAPSHPPPTDAKKPNPSEPEKKTINPTVKKDEPTSKPTASKVQVSQPSVSSLTDTSSTAPTPSLPVKPLQSKPLATQDPDEDSDFFDRDVPVTSTAAYKAMVSGTKGPGTGIPTESDSDDLEGQMSALVAKRDVPKSRPGFKPFASSIPSLRPAPPSTDTDSVDSVEAAIQAAMNKPKDQGEKPGPPPETDAAPSQTERPAGVKATSAPAPRALLGKPRPSAALQLNLDSDSESGGVSAGADASDDDDFDFYD
ncbi:proteoglycan 4-like isoform X2 [Penaeus japonicus]|uniref:proteoglycan 4-like isoform X2 n=1 Tax=Penaeus japonicus TaxID=27405 RepID=UPI001C710E09|nr:proteoglycan 4-like isoform X2 [Penaeus japonicus]